MKKIMASVIFVAALAVIAASAFAQKQEGPPDVVVAILEEVNEILKVQETRKNLGFIERTPDRETYPIGFVHIVGQTKDGTAFVIDSFISWVSPEENKYLIPSLAAGKTVPAVWWWKDGKVFRWKAPELPEDAPGSIPPAGTPTRTLINGPYRHFGGGFLEGI